jgi:hypothetical protein
MSHRLTGEKAPLLKCTSGLRAGEMENQSGTPDGEGRRPTSHPTPFRWTWWTFILGAHICCLYVRSVNFSVIFVVCAEVLFFGVPRFKESGAHLTPPHPTPPHPTPPHPTQENKLSHVGFEWVLTRQKCAEKWCAPFWDPRWPTLVSLNNQIFNFPFWGNFG